MSAPPLFGFGHFLGTFSHRFVCDGFQVSDIRPAVADRAVPRHTHDEAHFVLVLEGRYLTEARGAPPVCGPGALVYNPPGTTHRDRFRSRQGRFVTVSVEDRAFMNMPDAGDLPERALYLSAPESTRTAMRLGQECLGADITARFSIESLAWGLLDQVAHGGTRLATPPAWLARAREMMHDRAAEPLRLSEIAAADGVHPVHLTRTFKRFYRSTPADYLQAYRLERAAALLRAPRAHLADIAAECGFADQSHLTHAFTRAFGMPPGRYRALASSRSAGGRAMFL